jgi:leucyl aminopeptidase
MAKLPIISFSDLAAPAKGAVVFLMGTETGLGKIAGLLDGDGRLAKALEIADFKGKLGTSVEMLAPGGDFDKFVVVGCGNIGENGETQWLRVGGKAFSSVEKASQATLVCETGKGGLAAEAVAAMAAGAKLRAYRFDAYKTKDKSVAKAVKLALATDAAGPARRAWKAADGITDGVLLARDLVNEPANILGTVEFAARAKELSKLGVDVEILDEKALKKLNMNALLGVAQGSERPARVVVMKWNGGKSGTAPVAFVGKGVVFDTGGISIKPAANMEDMKGDMGGAAAVTGVMHALAARKAKTNAVGIIGLVENMPDGKAQRPGDIVTSMSGQTIEVLNTDAEGRLVLADILWYCQDRFKPQFMINLATLTGAILVALGNHHAGLFSNNDELCGRLSEAGRLTGEKVWRMPLGEEYDKLIDSKNADMKNIGGRWAGSITAGQFLQRFVNDVPWAHLDVAGTAMGSPKTEYNQSWASGYGVRLLDRLVSENYEK